MLDLAVEGEDALLILASKPVLPGPSAVAATTVLRCTASGTTRRCLSVQDLSFRWAFGAGLLWSWHEARRGSRWLGWDLTTGRVARHLDTKAERGTIAFLNEQVWTVGRSKVEMFDRDAAHRVGLNRADWGRPPKAPDKELLTPSQVAEVIADRVRERIEQPGYALDEVTGLWNPELDHWQQEMRLLFVSVENECVIVQFTYLPDPEPVFGWRFPLPIEDSDVDDVVSDIALTLMEEIDCGILERMPRNAKQGIVWVEPEYS